MGHIVAALGTCHTPYLFTRPPDENPQQLDAAAAAMQELGKVLDDTKPDAIVFLGSDHVETLSVTCIPSFVISGRRERVALVASGGMSHFPGTRKYLTPEFDFDRWLVSQFESGNTDALLNMTGTQLDEVGNTEMLNWAVMFGAIGAQAGELVEYIPTWHHGLCIMRFLPQRERKTAPAAAQAQYGGFQFQNQGFQFYKHPPAEAYGLNRLLFEVRHSAGLRDRILENLDAVAREYELNPQQRIAAEELINVGKGGLVSEHVGPLVEAGAHPLQALMSLHVIFSMSHQAAPRS